MLYKEISFYSRWKNSYVIFTFFQIDQGGLGLPERQYYLNESDRKVGQEYKMFKQWIVTNLKMFVSTHRWSYETTSFIKEQYIASIYINKTFPTTHF